MPNDLHSAARRVLDIWERTLATGPLNAALADLRSALQQPMQDEVFGLFVIEWTDAAGEKIPTTVPVWKDVEDGCWYAESGVVDYLASGDTKEEAIRHFHAGFAATELLRAERRERAPSTSALAQPQGQESVLMTRLREANSLLRSAASIAAREGVETNWQAFAGQVKKELQREHPLMYPDHAETCGDPECRFQT